MHSVHLHKSRYIVFFSPPELFAFLLIMCNVHLIPPPHQSSHHNLHNPRQRHRDLLFRRTSRHHQGPASHLHHLNHHYHIIAASPLPLQWTQSWFCVAGLLCRTRTTRMVSSHQNQGPIDRYIWLPMGCIKRWEINHCLLLCQIIILSNGNPLHRWNNGTTLTTRSSQLQRRSPTWWRTWGLSAKFKNQSQHLFLSL